MKNISIPGFSAQVSIYQSTATYLTSSFGGSPGGVAVDEAGSVLPQMIATGEYWNCVAEHREAGFSMDLSAFFCAGEGGDSGPRGPQEQVCTPGCSKQCGPSSEGLPGRWKTCIKRNCDDYEVRCR